MKNEEQLQYRANLYYKAIVEQFKAVQSVSSDIIDKNDLNWTDVGNLSHIRNQLADILEGWEHRGVKCYREIGK